MLRVGNHRYPETQGVEEGSFSALRVISFFFFLIIFNVGLKLNIQKTKIMASGPITSWEIDGETVADFILGGSKLTSDGDCSHSTDPSSHRSQTSAEAGHVHLELY